MPVLVTSIFEHVAVRFIPGFIYTPINVCWVTSDPMVRPVYCFYVDRLRVYLRRLIDKSEVPLTPLHALHTHFVSWEFHLCNPETFHN